MTDDFSAPDILEALRAAPERSDATERAGLQAFLAQARVWRGGVSARPAPRLTGWKFNFFKKEISPMTTLATIILVMALAVGGTGGAVYAAQDSLPTEPLYAVKLAAEQTRLAWATDPAESYLASAEEMQAVLGEAGFIAELFEDTSDVHLSRTAANATPAAPGQLSLAVFVDDLGLKAGNARRSLEERQVRLVRGVFRAATR